jgi:hypothetical protein
VLLARARIAASFVSVYDVYLRGGLHHHHMNVDSALPIGTMIPERGPDRNLDGSKGDTNKKGKY